MIHNPEVGSSSLPRATKATRYISGGLAILILLAGLAGCNEAGSFTAQDELSIRQVLADQESAWDRGDIHAFMEGYADSVCFIGKNGRNCGKEAVTQNYLRNYPDKAAMGDLTFDLHEVIGAGQGHAWGTGNWSLHRQVDTLAGGFSLLWSNSSGSWRIIRDHSY
jgi:ketosteroid isomerase-like protein